MKELQKNELLEIDGGKLEYSWSGTSNPLLYAAEAISNGIKFIYNLF